MKTTKKNYTPQTKSLKTKTPAEISLSEKNILCKTCISNFNFHKKRGDINMWDSCGLCKARIKDRFVFESYVKEAVKKILERIDNLDLMEYFDSEFTRKAGQILLRKVEEIIKQEMGRRLTE